MMVGLIFLLIIGTPSKATVIINGIDQNLHVKQRIFFNPPPLRGEKTIMTLEIIPQEQLDSVWVVFRSFKGITLLSSDTVFHFNARPGLALKFQLKVRFNDEKVSFVSDIRCKRYEGMIGLRFIRYLMDGRTGAYGSMKEIQVQRPALYRFDPRRRKFVQEIYGFEADRRKRNQEIIDTLALLTPGLSDSLYLSLYADAFRIPGLATYRTWVENAQSLLDHGWDTLKTRTQHDALIRIIADQMLGEQIRREKEERRILARQRMSWLMSWMVPAILLVIVVVILLYLNRRIKTKKITSTLFDRIITYLIYAFAIGSAFYFARPYLFLRIERGKTHIPAVAPQKAPVVMNNEPEKRTVIENLHGLLYARCIEAGLDSEYAYGHVKIINAVLICPYVMALHDRLETVIRVDTLVKAWLKLDTGIDWIESLNDSEGIYIWVAFEYETARKRLERYYEFSSGDRYQRVDIIDTAGFYLKPLKGLIPYDEARKKIFAQVPEESFVPKFSIILNAAKEQNVPGNYLFLTGAGYKVDLETGEVRKLIDVNQRRTAIQNTGRLID